MLLIVRSHPMNPRGSDHMRSNASACARGGEGEREREGEGEGEGEGKAEGDVNAASPDRLPRRLTVLT
jgi:hypothetical protein